MKKYYPYTSDKPNKKYFIITNDNKKIFFGNDNYEHFTEGHLDIDRRNRYLLRHYKNEDWNDPNTSGFWSARYLWSVETYNKAINLINHYLNNYYFKK